MDIAGITGWVSSEYQVGACVEIQARVVGSWSKDGSVCGVGRGRRLFQGLGDAGLLTHIRHQLRTVGHFHQFKFKEIRRRQYGGKNKENTPAYGGVKTDDEDRTKQLHQSIGRRDTEVRQVAFVDKNLKEMQPVGLSDIFAAQ